MGENKKMISTILRKLKNFITRNYMRIYSKFHKTEGKVLFSSFAGKQYSDNPRAISEKLHELYPKINIVWYIHDHQDSYNMIPDYVRFVGKNKLSFYKEVATASCFVTNEAMEPNISKNKNQFFIQTWHGDRAFKKILYDVWDEKNEKRPIEIIDNKITDLCVAASDFGVNVYKTAFRYNGNILCVGSPRNDRLIDLKEGDICNIKNKLNIEMKKKILLYAPTFRDSNLDKRQNITLDLDEVLRDLENNGDEWFCLLRAHSLSKGLEMPFDNKEHFMDVTDYPDIADLLCISDFLITDYSSCACDFVLRKKPVVLFIPDKDEYQQKSRTFKADPEEVGFYTATSTEELLNIIETTTEDDFVKSCDRVNKYYGTKETGHASEAACNIINDFIEKNF